MWEDILTAETLSFMVKTTLEEAEQVTNFFELLKQRVQDYKIIVLLATRWDRYADIKQANFAVTYAGMYNASRFIILMDYLNMKFKKGELTNG